MSRSKSRPRAQGDAVLTMSNVMTSKLRVFGVALLGAKVALVPLIFDFSLDAPFAVSKALVSHGLAYLLGAVIASLAIRFGRPFFVWSWLHVPVIAYLAANVTATIFAADQSLALYGTHVRMLGLGTTADLVLVYFSVVLLVRTRPEAFALVASTLAASVVVLGYEVVQWAGKDPFEWTSNSAARPFSTLGNATVLAQYCTVLALVAAACALLINGLHIAVRAVMLLYSVVLVLGSAVTGSRSALLGLGAGSVVLLFLVWRSNPSRRARVTTLLGTACAVGVLAAVLLFSPLGARVSASLENLAIADDDDELARLEPSVVARLALFELGLNMVRERPILGYGPDNFVVGVPRYRPEAAPSEVRQSLATSAHSWIMQVATSTGIVGLVLYVAIFGVALTLALRVSLRPVAFVGLVALCAFLGTGLTTVSEIGTEWLFWASVGAVAASTGRPVAPPERAARTRSRVNRPSSRTPNVMSIALIVVAIFAAASGVRALEASRMAREAQLSAGSEQSVDRALRATQSDPGRSEYWHRLGLANVGVRKWPQAIAAFDRARQLAPYNSAYIRDLATAQLLLAGSGDRVARARAQELGEKAVQVDPNNPRAHLTRAVVLYVLGDPPGALTAIVRALALDPGSTNARLYVTAAQVMIDSGRAADAVIVARKGLVLIGPTRGSVPIRLELARALASDARPAEAVIELDAALVIQPDEPSLLRLRTQILASNPN